jgi:hypothetical protein
MEDGGRMMDEWGPETRIQTIKIIEELIFNKKTIIMQHQPTRFH